MGQNEGSIGQLKVGFGRVFGDSFARLSVFEDGWRDGDGGGGTSCNRANFVGNFGTEFRWSRPARKDL
jgi:hypothetical protein